MNWRIHHQESTVSTNIDARAGGHGDVYTADYQSAGRGRLDHKWLSPPGANLMMSVVLSVDKLEPEQVATLPLAVGLAVVHGLSPFIQGLSPQLKWPNDVLVGGRKLAGILCERNGDCVIAGIGVNVQQRDFPSEIADRAVSLGNILGNSGTVPSIGTVRDALLTSLEVVYALWRQGGFAAVYPMIQSIDYLRGQALSVRQTDDDAEPIRGVCGGIHSDGSLAVGDVKVYAGEAHVCSC